MPALAITLEEHGRLLAPAPNVPFPVHDPACLWIVLSGKLDLSLIAVKNGKPSGARHHIIRVEEGHAVFGIGFGSRSGMAIMASAAPHTQIVCASKWDLSRYLSETEDDRIVRLLDDWITQLYSVLTDNTVPPEVLTLGPGEKFVVPEDEDRNDQVVVAKEGVTWIQHGRGRSRFLGNDQLAAIADSEPFPVSRPGWLLSSPKSLLKGLNTKTVLAGSTDWHPVQTFHDHVVAALILKQQQEDEREKKRLETRAATEAASMRAALLQLTSPLEQTEDNTAPDEALLDEPIFRACQQVGKAAGIQMKPHPDMVRGIKLRDAVGSIAKASGVRLRRVALKGSWWKMDSGPFLGFREPGSSPVAVIPVSPGKYELYDPATERRVPVNTEVAGTLESFGYVFYRPFPAKQLSVFDLLMFGLHGCRRELMTVIFMGLAVGALSLLTPYATGIIFNSLIPGAERHQLIQLVVILIVGGLSTAAFSLTSSLATLRMEGKMDASIQAAVWDRLLNLPVPFFRDFSAGDLATRSLAINDIRRAITGTTITSLLTGIFSFFSFVMLFYYDSNLAILVSGLTLFAFCFTGVCGFALVRYQRRMFHLRGNLSGMVLQFVTGVAKLRGTGTESHAFVAWAKEFTRQKHLALSARRVMNRVTIFSAVFPVVCWVAIFYYHSYLAAQPNASRLSTGDFLAFNAAFSQFLVATLLLSTSIVSIAGIVPLYERIKPIVRTLPEVNLAKSSPGRLTGAIEISHVNFRYKPDAPPVLRDISLSIRPGEYVAFVGPSGSGKSTLLRLLLGFDVPESGAVYFDGQDMSHLDVQDVRRQMGVVLQTGRLVSGDIFTNIVGNSPLTLEDAWEAARLAGMDEDIRSMPMGLHTVVSEGGGGLSGGQRQRLLIARAIVHRPRILLFDEATSALDNNTQAIVSRSLESLQATRIVIAHRLSTILNADRIFVIEKGIVVQSGTYAQLLAEEGLFRELARRQLT